MKSIVTFEEWIEITEKEKEFLLFVKTDNCSVCDGLYPQVEVLQKDFPLPFYIVNAVNSPEIAGQLSLFSAPVVLLFSEGREYARFARFVPINDLKIRLQELVERGNSVD